VATSVARIILRPAGHFLRPFFVSAIFVSAMSNFRAGFINALQIPSGAKVCARELGRPSGTCICYRFSTRRGSAGLFSAVPPGLAPVAVSQPGAEAPGYFRSSLRDLGHSSSFPSAERLAEKLDSRCPAPKRVSDFEGLTVSLNNLRKKSSTAQEAHLRR
jgi:hypothetical protein